MLMPSDYDWLASLEGQDAWNRILAHATAPSLPEIKSVARCSGRHAALLLEQWQFAHGKARDKVEDPTRWVWTHRLLEQASDEWTARETSLDAPLSVPQWVDVCCGAGVDCIALARRRSAVLGIDADPIPLSLMRANAAFNQVSVDGMVGAAESMMLDHHMFLHVDPDRRAHGRRTIDLTHSLPSWEWISQAVGRCAAVSLKLAPGWRVDDRWDWGAPSQPNAQRWLSWQASVRQQRWYWGIDRWPDGSRIASCGNSKTGWHHEVFEGSAFRTLPTWADSIDSISQLSDSYVADQDPVVRAADVGDLLSQRLEVQCIGDRNGYFVSPHPVGHPMLRWYRVIEVLPLDLKRVRAMARRIGASYWELKSRGVDMDLITLTKNLPLDPKTERRMTILLTRLGKRHVAIFAQLQEKDDK
jgi:SAM-dependent methyltransferase